MPDIETILRIQALNIKRNLPQVLINEDLFITEFHKARAKILLCFTELLVAIIRRPINNQFGRISPPPLKCRAAHPGPHSMQLQHIDPDGTAAPPGT